MARFSRGIYAYVAAATVGLGALTASIVTWSPEPDLSARPAANVTVDDPSDEPTAAAEPDSEPVVEARPDTRRQRIEDRRTHVVVVGDAFATGSTLEGEPTWPTLLGRTYSWETRTIVADDAGFLAGDDDRIAEAISGNKLARFPADLVIVSAGAADLLAGDTGIGDDASAAIQRVRAKLPTSDIVLLSPFSPGPPDERTLQLTDTLRKVAERNDIGFWDVSEIFTGRAEDQIADGITGDVPTVRGQQLIATSVGKYLQRKQWPRYDAWLDLAGPP